MNGLGVNNVLECIVCLLLLFVICFLAEFPLNKQDVSLRLRSVFIGGRGSREWSLSNCSETDARQRKHLYGSLLDNNLISLIMAVRTQFESSNDIGVFARLTNAYCLVGIGGSENFYSTFESELSDHIPVIHTSIGEFR